MATTTIRPAVLRKLRTRAGDADEDDVHEADDAAHPTIGSGNDGDVGAAANTTTVVKRKRAALTGLVLSGGGARGAYEAGVVKYIRNELPPRTRTHARFEIICGTSVGAINTCFLAASAHQHDVQGRALADVWERLRIDGVYRVGARELLNLPRFLLGSRGRGDLDDAVGPGRLGGLLNTSPLEQLVRRGTRWAFIERNLQDGILHGVCVNATHVSSGKTHSFVHTKDGVIPPWSTDPGIVARAVKLGAEHALASAAIPWIFPCVDIDGHVYADGGLKLNTPISPAIRLGADRLLVIGLRAAEEPAEGMMPRVDGPGGADRVEHSPSAAFLLGKILNSFLSDKTEYDLQRLERFNALIEAGERAYGDGFVDALGAAMAKRRGQTYRKVDALLVRPNEDIAAVAAKHLRLGSVITRAGPIVGPLLRRLAGTGGEREGDLLSYLLFDGEYAADLVAMGMRDADAMRQQLIDFFAV
jgi:NTE family protein